MSMIRTSLALFAALLCLALTLQPRSSAAEPPDIVNYQGVLRGSDDSPLDGNHDIVFSFWSAAVGGDEILVDSHTAAGGAAVNVTGGLFNVSLGSGSLADGSGPGTYAALNEVFRDHADVWLAIQVGGETLSPRVRIAATPYAANAKHLGGKTAGEFIDTGTIEQSRIGKLVIGQSSGTPTSYGLEAYGLWGGGYFEDSGGSSSARVGAPDLGVWAEGTGAGGRFEDRDSTAYADLGSFGRGILAYGDATGSYAAGVFENLGGATGKAYLAKGELGIESYGSQAGGFFQDTSNTGFAYVGYGSYGIAGYGDDAGAYFEDLTAGGQAWVGVNGIGISAQGSGGPGGIFDAGTSDSGLAWVASGDQGIEAYGSDVGGYFRDSDSTGLAYVGMGDRGIWARGTFAGGTFSHPDNVTHWADVSTSTRKIAGTGTVSFVQNHPYERDKVVVYAAPEGDEVAVYTRGSARLVDGEARVHLGETFALVANPDIGLTVHLTARGEPVALAAAEVSTGEILVRGPAGSDATFDFIVYGLRIGFEDVAIVQEKTRDAFLPAREDVVRDYATHPELRRFSAFERFNAMRVARGENRASDLSRSAALASAIDDRRETIVAAARAEAEAVDSARPRAREAQPAAEQLPPSTPREPRVVEVVEATDVAQAAALAPGDAGLWLAVTLATEAGEVLAIDLDEPGALSPATSTIHATVIGIAADHSRQASAGGLEVPLAEGRYATVKVDAGYGAIRAADRLILSPTPGHAMLALDGVAGVPVGTAIEALDSGTGSIRVLLSLR